MGATGVCGLGWLYGGGEDGLCLVEREWVSMSACCVLVLLRLVCLRACLDVCDVFLAGCQMFLSCVLVGYLCRLWGGRSCAGLLPDVLVMAYCRVEWGCTCF